jgi:trimeric autotransporter adhesin
MKLRLACVVIGFLSLVLFTIAQTSTQTVSALPRLVRFGGTVKDLNGNPLTGIVGITFAFYSEKTGGAPLWIESQNATADSTGQYTVLLGSTKPEGLPAELFTSEQARWVGVQVSGQAEQPRVLLVAVPYAMKAADAETVGGLPPSAFVLAARPIGAGNATSTVDTSSNGLSPSLSGTGTTDFLPLWTSSTALGSSALFQTGSGSSAKIGINTITPQAMLDVKGSVTIRSLLNLPALSSATASTGANSNQIGFVASVFNSSTHAAVNEVFRWLAEPASNNTSAPSATLNLLFGTAPTAPTETGLKINHKGQITFASGQTFPGTGSGTITGVTAGTALTGGGTSGVVTLNLDTTQVPRLAANNTFSGNNTFDAATIFQTIQADGQTTVGLPTSGTFPTLTAQLTVFSTGPTGWDGIDTTGGAEVGSGISATGGDETASSSIQGGTGGTFTGGFSPGTTGDGVFATPGDATFSSGPGWAGLFIGDIDVTGVVFGSVKDFKVDHPLDPANKYLVHASVESSEMMNIYSGNVVTDELGLARVKLPDWFEAENTDFRYQLTVIGGRFAQAIVSKEIADHQFTISTNATNVKVSWQVTAVRKDAFAKAHPLVVEQQKPAHERGFYQNPELFGQPAEKQTEWGRHPQQMQHMKAMHEQQKLQSQQHAALQRPAASVVQSPAPGFQPSNPVSQLESK